VYHHAYCDGQQVFSCPPRTTRYRIGFRHALLNKARLMRWEPLYAFFLICFVGSAQLGNRLSRISTEATVRFGDSPVGSLLPASTISSFSSEIVWVGRNGRLLLSWERRDLEETFIHFRRTPEACTIVVFTFGPFSTRALLVYITFKPLRQETT
jgi:hypothetical protein